jgi:hypothetical protein
MCVLYSFRTNLAAAPRKDKAETVKETAAAEPEDKSGKKSSKKKN